jgi:hypothetical protein
MTRSSPPLLDVGYMTYANQREHLSGKEVLHGSIMWGTRGAKGGGNVPIGNRSTSPIWP